MAKTKISEFSSTAGNNTDIDSINIAEGCAPSGINNAIRELMAQLKDFQTGAAGDSFNGPVGTTTAAAGAFTNLTASGTLGVTGVATLGNGAVLGTPASVTLTNGTGLPIATGVSGLGTGIATALAVNVGSAGAPVINGGALGTPSSGTVTNLTGTASININGTVGATTPTTGAFTTLTTSSTVTLNGGTANGVSYLDASKVLTTGSALTFDGTNFASTGIITSTNANGLRAQYPVSASYYAQLDSRDGNTYLSAIGSTAAIVFRATDGPGTTAEGMRLTSTGLGIGTSSPAVKLEVLRGSEGEYLRAGGDDTGNNGRGLRFTSSTNSGFIGAKHTLNAPSAGGAIAFATASTERAVIDSSGNLGLGVTPSAWDTTVFRTLQVGSGAGSASLSGRTDSAQALVLASNTYYSSTGYRYIGTSSATGYVQQNSTHYWLTAGSGTAGDLISFTQAMTLDASGRLLVGGTTGTAGGRLTVTTANGGYAAIEPTSSVTSQIATGLRLHGNINETDRYVGIFCFNGAANNVNSMTFWTTNSGVSSERMRLDNLGNLGIGTSSPASYNAGGNSLVVGGSGNYKGMTIASAIEGNIYFADGTSGTETYRGIVGYNHTSDFMAFYTAANERARIDSSGNLIQTVNTTAATLATNNTLTFSIVDNSTLRISVRGSDGTTRTATVALT